MVVIISRFATKCCLCVQCDCFLGIHAEDILQLRNIVASNLAMNCLKYPVEHGFAWKIGLLLSKVKVVSKATARKTVRANVFTLLNGFRRASWKILSDWWLAWETQLHVFMTQAGFCEHIRKHLKWILNQKKTDEPGRTYAIYWKIKHFDERESEFLVSTMWPLTRLIYKDAGIWLKTGKIQTGRFKFIALILSY